MVMRMQGYNLHLVSLAGVYITVISSCPVHNKDVSVGVSMYITGWLGPKSDYLWPIPDKLIVGTRVKF